MKVYRATKDALRSTWRRDGIDIAEMEEAAEEALDWLAGVEIRHSIERRRRSRGGGLAQSPGERNTTLGRWYRRHPSNR